VAGPKRRLQNKAASTIDAEVRGYMSEETGLTDEQVLQSFGYRQELRRAVRLFSLYAVAFSIISITTRPVPGRPAARAAALRGARRAPSPAAGDSCHRWLGWISGDRRVRQAGRLSRYPRSVGSRAGLDAASARRAMLLRRVRLFHAVRPTTL